MGNAKKKPKLDYATMSIKFESQGLIFSFDQPLLFTIEIDSSKQIGAYGI